LIVNVLGLITARGGSKGIPGKNLASCAGRPLIAWTCDAARARCVTRAIVSTDDPQIADVARREGVEAPFSRPAELASDTARSIDVARHAISWLADNERWTADIVVLLQPTSPLRTARHVDEAFALLESELEAVVSVVEVPHHFAPWSQLVLDGGRVRDYDTRELPFDRFRRQGQPHLYARNGPAVVVTRAATIHAGSFYGERCAAYVMQPRDSVDIDDRDDLELAQWLLQRRAEAD
jgi:CMP-N,N'-diacetyllegionaminic acid synthase